MSNTQIYLTDGSAFLTVKLMQQAYVSLATKPYFWPSPLVDIYLYVAEISGELL
jgi:hypothetical protein